MLEKQIKGLIVAVLILAIIPFFIMFANIFLNYKMPILIDQNKNSIAVEIRGKDIYSGIYFIPNGNSANNMMELTGSDFRFNKDFQMKNGMKLLIDSNSVKKISLTSIENARKLALGMPIDLNAATKDDLLLIPGIGETTAQKILMLKSKKGNFQKIEELMETEGIKEKKFAKLKQYLFLQNKE